MFAISNLINANSFLAQTQEIVLEDILMRFVKEFQYKHYSR